MSRGEKAGIQFANAIREMVNLMYQNNTAIYFLEALIGLLTIELRDRQGK